MVRENQLLHDPIHSTFQSIEKFRSPLAILRRKTRSMLQVLPRCLAYVRTLFSRKFL